jgi:membrane-bound serine protease (ClpP class)
MVWAGIFRKTASLVSHNSLLLSFLLCLLTPVITEAQVSSGDSPIVIGTIDGPINPATDDYLKSIVLRAEKENAQLIVIRLNTPGGLLSSMQTMVQVLLESDIPIAVYVSPRGGGAISAGVFITLAADIAVMAPGTTIGAAHPVLGDGSNVKGDMREKIENFTVSLITAIAEQRGRNVQWAEQAVRESVAITDREALEEGVIDYVASDLNSLLEKIEGKTLSLKGQPKTIRNLASAPRVEVKMSLKQLVVNILADPNIAVLLGLGALLGIAIELYHPGGVLPGVFGVICLVLSLAAGQILPISSAGVVLLCLGFVLFGVELFIPSFGVWGAAGIVSMVLGAVYFLDTDQIWSGSEYGVNRWAIGSLAALAGSLILSVVFLALRAKERKVTTGREGMVGQRGSVRSTFAPDPNRPNILVGKVDLLGSIWNARFEGGVDVSPPSFEKGDGVLVDAVEGITLVVVPE